MVDERKNVKCSPETFVRLQEQRGDKQWDAFLNMLLDIYEERGTSDVTAKDIDRIIEKIDNVPGNTAQRIREELNSPY